MVDHIRSKFGAATCTPDAPVDQSMGKALNQSFQNSLSALADTHDVVVLGDTDHEKLGTKWFVDNNVVDTLAKSGVKTLYLELDPADQKKVNDFMAGRMSADDFTKDVSSHYVGGERDITDLVSQAKKNGMKVVAADNPKAGEEAQLAGKFSMMADVMGDDDPQGQAYRQQEYEHLKKRMGYDVELAQTVNTTRGDDKAAVIFGANHGRTENGLMDNLRGTAVKMDVYANTVAEQADTLKQDQAIGALARKPDAVYIDSQSTVYATCNTPPNVAAALSTPTSLPDMEMAKQEIQRKPALPQNTGPVAAAG